MKMIEKSPQCLFERNISYYQGIGMLMTAQRRIYVANDGEGTVVALCSTADTF